MPWSVRAAARARRLWSPARAEGRRWPAPAARRLPRLSPPLLARGRGPSRRPASPGCDECWAAGSPARGSASSAWRVPVRVDLGRGQPPRVRRSVACPGRRRNRSRPPRAARRVARPSPARARAGLTRASGVLRPRRRRPWLRSGPLARLPSGAPRGRASESPRVAPLPLPLADSPAAPRRSPGESPSSESPRERAPAPGRPRPPAAGGAARGSRPSPGGSPRPSHRAGVRPSPRTPRVPGRRRPRLGRYPGEPPRPSRRPSGRPSPRARSSESPAARRPPPAAPPRPRSRMSCDAARALRRPAWCARAASARAVANERARPGACVHFLSVLPRSGGTYAAPKCTYCILHRCCHAQVGLTPRPDECSHILCTGSTRSRGPRRADTSTRILGGAVTLGWAASLRRVHASTLPGVDTRRWAASRRHTEWPVVRLPSGTCAAWRTRGGMLARRRKRADTYTYTAGSARRRRLPLVGPGPGAPAAPAACSSRAGRREGGPGRAAPSGRAWRHPAQAAESEFQGRSFLQTGAANRNADAAPLPAGCLSEAGTRVSCAHAFNQHNGRGPSPNQARLPQETQRVESAGPPAPGGRGRAGWFGALPTPRVRPRGGGGEGEASEAGAAPPGRPQGGGGRRLPPLAGWSWAGTAGPPRERGGRRAPGPCREEARPYSPWKGCLVSSVVELEEGGWGWARVRDAGHRPNASQVA